MIKTIKTRNVPRTYVEFFCLEQVGGVQFFTFQVEEVADRDRSALLKRLPVDAYGFQYFDSIAIEPEPMGSPDFERVPRTNLSTYYLGKKVCLVRDIEQSPYRDDIYQALCVGKSKHPMQTLLEYGITPTMWVFQTRIGNLFQILLGRSQEELIEV